MKVIVDTCIWSLALRRKQSSFEPLVKELSDLIQEVRVQLIGPIRQEILSGIKYRKQYQSLKNYLSAFPDLSIETSMYEQAADFYNTCRQRGIQGSNIDFLICSIAYNYEMPIFTIDNDFRLFEEHLPIKLYPLKTI